MKDGKPDRKKEEIEEVAPEGRLEEEAPGPPNIDGPLGQKSLDLGTFQILTLEQSAREAN